MIKTFKCKETEGIYEGRLSRRLPQDIQRAAARKLEMLSAATRLESLKVPPGNKLEKLSGDRAGQYLMYPLICVPKSKLGRLTFLHAPSPWQGEGGDGG